MIEARRLGIAQLDQLIITLARFYRSATPTLLSPGAYLVDWTHSLAYNKRVLLDSRVRFRQAWCSGSTLRNADFYSSVGILLPIVCAIAASWMDMVICAPNIFGSTTR